MINRHLGGLSPVREQMLDDACLYYQPWTPARCQCLFCQIGRLFPEQNRVPPPPTDYDDYDEKRKMGPPKYLPVHSGSSIALNKLPRRRTYYLPGRYTREAT